MKQQFQADVVVIGAGIAGLTAAALLSRQGYKVHVAERDIHVGGCAASYQRAGYSFAVGATVAMGFEAGGLHRKIYDRLGLVANYVSLNPMAMRVHLPDRVVPILTNRQAWFEALPRYFPELKAANLRACWLELARIAQAMRYVSSHFPVLPFRHWHDMYDTARAIHPQLWHLVRNLRATIGAKLRHYQVDSPAHRAFVDGQLLDAMQTTAVDCVASAGALALNIYRYGCQYMLGGLATVAEDLRRYIEAQGGKVHFATRVQQIHSHKQRIQGISSNRLEIDAPVVISAVPLSNTAALLDNNGQLQQRSQQQARMWGAFTLYLGVDARCLPVNSHYFEQVTDNDHYHDGGNLLISISPAWDSSRAPLGKRAITVSTHVEAEAWMQLERKSDAYRAKKQQLEHHLLNQIERAIPRIREGIDYVQSGSPRTFHNFTLRAGGTVGGFPQTQQHAVFNAPSHRSHIQGLFLAGDTIFPGQGTLGTTVSGYNAARSAQRYLAQQGSFW